MPESFKTRLVEAVGTRASLYVYWGEKECAGRFHSAEVFIAEELGPYNAQLGGEDSDHDDGSWPMSCDLCGMLVPSYEPREVCACGCGKSWASSKGPQRWVFRRSLYRAPGGELRDKLEVGDMYIRKHEGLCYARWSNCDGAHLTIQCPDGAGGTAEWDIDSRAGNCGSPNDLTHRCWVRTGDPALRTVHVTKGPSGHISSTSCTAGGSIQINAVKGHYPGWHGFLSHGNLHV